MLVLIAVKGRSIWVSSEDVCLFSFFLILCKVDTHLYYRLLLYGNNAAAMSSAANFAWVNRSCITYLTRKAFADVFDRTADEMDMHLVYDVCHNIAKVEKHVVDGVEKTLLVHRKGSTRAFPPEHPNIPKDYQKIGQPVLIGGTMGTCSYVCKFVYCTTF